MHEEVFDYCISTYRVKLEYLTLKCKIEPYKVPSTTTRSYRRLYRSSRWVIGYIY